MTELEFYELVIDLTIEELTMLYEQLLDQANRRMLAPVRPG